ncbi:hypothetical protein DFH08DRAFT_802568 [Mycena albidolilacea]|uniref:Restriction of telomere capping protein 4 C-terminal domain-containing protein n=1 Tax=Mycena albidolilacea TaxID=1033008 RepID=A0AAD7AEB7_9AGAR|nr:hypothetical protein DFH08DRAFT_802568 [Mycena albidolilacea]
MPMLGFNSEPGLCLKDIQINCQSTPPRELETAKWPAPFPISKVSLRDVKRVRVDLIEELSGADDSEEEMSMDTKKKLLLLPQAETKGWPTSINWEDVKAWADNINSREINAFWLAVLKDKSNSSVAGQIVTFQNYQPGYGQGSLIIYQVLGDKFEAWDFTSKVLILEVALHLIMEDFQCGRDQAEEICIKSSAYGAAMLIAND